MGSHSRRFVDHHDRLIGEDHSHPAADRRGNRGTSRQDFGELDVDPSACYQAIGLADLSSVNQDFARRRKIGCLCARKPQQTRQPDIDPLPLKPLRDGQSASLTGTRRAWFRRI